VLGFTTGQYSEGQAARLNLTAAVDTYFFEDVAGSDEYFYKTRFYNSTTTAFSEYSDSTKGSLYDVVPEQQADSKAPRSLTLIRGTTNTFRFSFFEDLSRNIPLVPKDISKYPSYVIIDIVGQTIASGVAVCDETAGNYRIDFTVPTDAILSNDDRRWRVEVLLLSVDNRQVQQIQQFDVRDVDATESQIKEIKFLALDGKSFRALIRLPKRPISIDATVQQSQSTLMLASDNLGGNVREIIDGETFVYAWDIPAGILKAGVDPLTSSYLVIWTIQQSAASQVDYQFQVIEVPLTSILPYFASLRMAIDKYQKRRDIVQAFQDSDIYEYLAQGLRVVNGYMPLTQYNFSTIPTELAHHWLMGSLLWGLNAQHLLENDIAFEFCVEENTLIRTTRGLVKVKDLVGVKQTELASERLLTDEDKDIFTRILDNMSTGLHYTKDIATKCGLDFTAQRLGIRLNKFNLNVFRQHDGAGHWLWDVSMFWKHLEPYGFKTNKDPEKFSSKFDLTLLGKANKPLCVWDLGIKEVKRVTTYLGYDLEGTDEHKFLVLNAATLDMNWKKLSELQVGDYIPIDTTEESDSDWEVPFDDLSHLNTNTTKSPYNLPTKLTPELARLLGNWTAEGCGTMDNVVSFGSSDSKMNKQFCRDFESCFGSQPDYAGFGLMTPGNLAYDPSVEYTNVEYWCGRGVELRRFLSSIGLNYEKSRKKEIPWCILQAPLKLAAEFLKTYFDGDGCYQSGQVIFCSTSDVLRKQVQVLLLRFGIVSVNDKSAKVVVRGPSFNKYVEKIGFLTKGEAILNKKMYPQLESIPKDLFFTLANIERFIPQIAYKGWLTNKDGSKRRVSTKWKWGRHVAYGTTHVTWDHVQRWWEDVKQIVMELAPSYIVERVEFLLSTRFQWSEVTSIESGGPKRVLDPSLVGGSNLLDHGICTNGIVTHNSGQNVTLNYDHKSGLSEGYQRAIDFLQTSITQTKTPLLRRGSATGVYAGRTYRFNLMQNYVVKIDSSGSSSNFLTLLSNIGLL
jgi:intein/homing endonuclease